MQEQALVRGPVPEQAREPGLLLRGLLLRGLPVQARGLVPLPGGLR